MFFFFQYLYFDPDGKILSGHDVSDGGLVTCLVEMSIAGISGLDIEINHKPGTPVEVLFAEEVGWVLEVREKHFNEVLEVFKQNQAPVAHVIGKSVGLGMNSKVKVLVNKKQVLESTVLSLKNTWEETSYQLELRQTNADCATQEYKNFKDRSFPVYKLTFDPDAPLYENVNCKSITFTILKHSNEKKKKKNFFDYSENTGSSTQRRRNKR